MSGMLRDVAVGAPLPDDACGFAPRVRQAFSFSYLNDLSPRVSIMKSDFES